MIKIFKTKKGYRKTERLINPTIYWKLVLFIGFLLVLASVLFGLYLFMIINQEFVAPQGNTTSGIETVSKERIDSVLKYFSDRDQKSTQIINSRSPITDPSL